MDFAQLSQRLKGLGFNPSKGQVRNLAHAIEHAFLAGTIDIQEADSLIDQAWAVWPDKNC